MNKKERRFSENEGSVATGVKENRSSLLAKRSEQVNTKAIPRPHYP